MSVIIKRRILIGGMIALAFVGLTVTGTLLGDHDGGWVTEHHTGTAFLLQLCSSTALPSASCADVVASRWGSFDFYLGERRILVPMSFLGFAYFLTVVIWLTFCGLPPVGARWRRRAVALFAGAGLSVSIALTAVMGYSLEHWCPLCMLAHVTNLGLGVLLFFSWRLDRTVPDPLVTGRETSHHQLERRLALVTLATAVVGVGATWIYFDTILETRRHWRRAGGLKNVIESLQGDAGFTLREFFAEPVQSIPLRDQGVADHRPTIVVFRSFTSDANACFEQDWRQAYAAQAGQALRVEYRQTPVALVRAVGAGIAPDDGDTVVLRAVEAARRQHHPRGYHRLTGYLFRARKSTTQPNVPALARQAGLDVDRLMIDMASDDVREAVFDDLALAGTLGVDYTPAIFIEGRRVPNVCVKSPAFWAAIGHEPGLTQSLASSDRAWIDHADAPRPVTSEPAP